MNNKNKFRAWDPFNKHMWGHEDCYINDLATFFKEYEETVKGGNEPVLMQYTGLKDKDGTEIYEGDIVEVSSRHYGIYKAPVIFLDGCFGLDNFSAVQIKNPSRWDMEHSCTASYGFNLRKLSGFHSGYSNIDGKMDPHKVIGNIYEHSDLLEEKKDA